MDIYYEFKHLRNCMQYFYYVYFHKILLSLDFRKSYTQMLRMSDVTINGVFNYFSTLIRKIQILHDSHHVCAYVHIHHKINAPETKVSRTILTLSNCTR